MGVQRSPLEIDLSEDSAIEHAEHASVPGPYVSFFLIVAGGVPVLYGTLVALGELPGSSGWGGVAIVAGLVPLGFGFLGLASGWQSEVTRLRIDDEAVEFIRANGKSRKFRWGDPQLAIDLNRFDGDLEIIPEEDARHARPQWIDVLSRPGGYLVIRTTLPSGGVASVVDRAEGLGVEVSRTRVAFYWHAVGKGLSFLDSTEEGNLHPGADQVNGDIIRIRNGGVRRGIGISPSL
jgi:hypothetical protein